MSARRRSRGALIALIGVVSLGGACTTSLTATSTTTTPVTRDDRSTVTTPATPTLTAPPTTSEVVAGDLRPGIALRRVVPASCRLSGAGAWTLPDPSCTPGALNPAVSPATISTTICVPGYSTRIRPSESFTYELKRSQMAAWGLAGSTSQTEEDHLVPLSLGGAPSDSANLWPEPGGIPNPKDRLEYRLYRMVCAGQIDLRSAQLAIASNWITAYQRFVGPTSGS